MTEPAAASGPGDESPARLPSRDTPQEPGTREGAAEEMSGKLKAARRS